MLERQFIVSELPNTNWYLMIMWLWELWVGYIGL